MLTKAGAKLLFEGGLGKRPTECTIHAHCQTRVFELPKMRISTAHPLQPAVFVERQDARATFVSDLADYFQNYTPFQHFSNSGVLHFKVSEAISKYTADSTYDWFPLFVVIEQKTPCVARLKMGTCYIVDQEYLGGYKGKDAIIAFRVDDGPWPKLDKKDKRFVNLVLAIIKIVQGETEVIREITGSSCFLDDLNRSVHSISMSVRGNLSSSSPITEEKLANKVCELQKLARAFEYKHSKDPKLIDQLCDALHLEDIENNHYLCAWYLSLFEATKKVLPKQEMKKFHWRHNNYRNSIGHPQPNEEMDMNQFRKLQSDAISTLKKHFLDT